MADLSCSDIYNDILAHLERNPRACATLVAIARFWLEDWGADQVARALDDLVTAGEIERRTIAGVHHYRKRSAANVGRGAIPLARVQLRTVTLEGMKAC